MRAAKSLSILLHVSSPSPQIFCAVEGVLFFHLRGGAGFQRSRNENFSSSSYSSPPQTSHSQWRHHDEESKGVKVAVWWDFENCNVPNGVNAFRVPHRITSALRSHGIRGPVSITAFGDVSQLSRSNQDALYTSGVCLNHVPSCGKNSSDRSLLADLVYWVAQNPPPVHFFLISGDSDFANILHRLRLNNYNILLACTDRASGALCSAATVMWQWNTLVRGESLTGRYFNHPPDGLYGSWYGHYRGSLDNPFGVSEEATSVQPEESVESIPDAKTRQIPKLLVNKIRQILHSYPEGINLTDLRAELKKNNVVMDKDYFGHKKFSHLLLSMPNILKLKFKPGDVQPLVYGVIHQRMTDPVDLSSMPATGVGNSTGDGEQSWGAENDRKPSPLSHQLDAENPCHKVEMATASRHNNVATAAKEQNALNEETKIVTTQDQDNVAVSCKVDVQPSDTQSNHMQKEEAINTDGLIRRIWKNLIARSSGSAEASISSSQTTSLLCESAQAITSTTVESSSNPESMGSKEEASELKTSGSSISSSDLVSSKHAVCSAADERERKIKTFQDPLTSSKVSSDPGQSAPCEANEGTDVTHNGAFRNSSFFNKIFTWCRFWRTNPKDHTTFSSKSQSDASEFPRESVEGQGLDLYPVSGTDISNSDSKHEPHDLFSKSHFWDSMESFLRTSKGSDVISKSRTRSTPPLPDTGQWLLLALNEMLPHWVVEVLRTHIIGLHHYLMLFMMLAFSVLFDSVKAPGLGLGARYMFTMAIGRLLRAITFISTILPSVRPWCAVSRFPVPSHPHPWAQEYYTPYSSDSNAIHKLIWTDTHYANVGAYPAEYKPDWGRMSFLIDILRPTVSEGPSWYHLLKKAGGGCNDLLYSGHMLVAVLTAMAWMEAYGGWTSALIWLLVLHSAQREVRERHHYSADCVVALYVGVLLWKMTGFIWSTKDISGAKRLAKLDEVQGRLLRAAKDSDMHQVSELLKEVELAGHDKQSSSQQALWIFGCITIFFSLSCVLLAFVMTSDG